MSEYLKYILSVKDIDDYSNNPRILNLIKKYDNWKSLIIQYSYQQYRIIKKELLSSQILYQKIII